MMSMWSKLISQYPTQLYYSVLPFLPSDTYLAHHYPTHTGGISILRGRDRSWSPLLFTLARETPSYKPAFAPKGQMVALASFSGIDLFDGLSGLLLSNMVAPEPSNILSHYICGATFSADASEVIVTRYWEFGVARYCDVVKYSVTRQIGQVHRTALVTEDDMLLIPLSEGGSYVAFPDFAESESRIRIWRTHGGDDTFVLMRHVDDIQSLQLSADSAHLIAVATGHEIFISDILSGNILQTLDDKDVRDMCISPNGSFLASMSPWGGIRVWSTTRGTLQSTLKNAGDILAFSHTNCLYMALYSGW